MGLHRFQASWASPQEPSQAHLVGPRESQFGYTHPPYLAVFIGGHDGIRISIHNPADVDNLAALLTVMAERFRAATSSGSWDETCLTAPPHPTASADPAAAVSEPAGAVR